MQPHWIEPAPLGDAQRSGIMRLPKPVQLPARYNPHMIYGQIRAEHSRLAGGAPPSRLHKALKYGTYLVGGAVGVFALVKAGKHFSNKPKDNAPDEDDFDDEVEVEGWEDQEGPEHVEVEESRLATTEKTEG